MKTAILVLLLFMVSGCRLNDAEPDTISLPASARKAVLDGDFASPLVRVLTNARSLLKGKFDEEIYRLPPDANLAELSNYYESEAAKANWKKIESGNSEVSRVTTDIWETPNRRKIAVALVELDASFGENRKFLAIYKETK